MSEDLDDIDSGCQENLSLPTILREPSQSDPQPPESSSLYYQSLKDLRFDSYALFESLPTSLKESLGSVAEMQNAMGRYNKEAKVLSQHLPCESHGAAFVRIDNERMDAYRALLSGTEDTPYAHGLYLFDIACPENYPSAPPKVRIATTGNGSARFNPNLYDDGFVCLSIINTWDGDPEERWNPFHSNLLQVLLSIQALVMDKYVIQKEPDYEYLEIDSAENILYSNIVKYNNLKWAVIGMLQNPPEEFREVVQRHFALKKRELVETLDAWIEQAYVNEPHIDYNHADYLVIDHNHETFELFRSTPFPELLKEFRPLLLQELGKLPDLAGPVTFQELPVFKTVKMNEGGGYRHALAHTLCDLVLYSEIQDRVAKDIERAVNTTYPVKVLIAVDPQRRDLVKLIVPGDPSSDYAFGMFLFELTVPYDYPASPPLILLKTTGCSSVSFAPQLPRQGDVDIPLLRTDWSPENSLRDVVLALCECLKGGLVQDFTSQAVLRLATLQYGVIEMNRFPPIEFREELHEHFMTVKNAIVSQTEKYLNVALPPDAEYSDEALPNPFLLQQLQKSGYATLLSGLLREFSAEFADYENPIDNIQLEELILLNENSEEEHKDLDLPVLKPESSKDPVAPDSTSPYFTAMKDFRASLQLFTPATHSLYSAAASEAAQHQGARYAKELQTLSKHLPCEAEGAVYVAVGDGRMDLMQALISGPADSPYAFGLYLFDIACPEDYPSSPPTVNIQTTGKSSVRFNPNLYSNGLVCLSVINTWGGNPEEMWNPAHSNVFQVLLSIQSLVMDKEVIMKEPGYEYTTVGGLENKQYSFVVKYSNLKYAVIENIREPPALFRETILQHFRIVKERLLELAAQWLEESKEEGVFSNIDPLVEDHNAAICQLFVERGLHCLFTELFQELQHSLNSL